MLCEDCKKIKCEKCGKEIKKNWWNNHMPCEHAVNNGKGCGRHDVDCCKK